MFFQCIFNRVAHVGIAGQAQSMLYLQLVENSVQQPCNISQWFRFSTDGNMVCKPTNTFKLIQLHCGAPIPHKIQSFSPIWPHTADQSKSINLNLPDYFTWPGGVLAMHTYCICGQPYNHDVGGPCSIQGQVTGKDALFLPLVTIIKH